MTDPTPTPAQSEPRTPRPRRRKPSAYPVIAGSLAAFMGLSGFLAYQLRTGHDPALGHQVALQQVVAPKRVLIKRIEDHVIVTKLLPPQEADDGGQPVQVAAVQSVPQGSSAPVVVQRAPVVVQSAPAPAPAPAPVVTKTS